MGQRRAKGGPSQWLCLAAELLEDRINVFKRAIHVLGLLGLGQHNLAAGKHQDNHVRLSHAESEAGKGLWLKPAWSRLRPKPLDAKHMATSVQSSRHKGNNRAKALFIRHGLAYVHEEAYCE